jgi:hypothetical protein
LQLICLDTKHTARGHQRWLLHVADQPRVVIQMCEQDFRRGGDHSLAPVVMLKPDMTHFF